MRVSTCVAAILLLTAHLIIAAPGHGQGNVNTKINLKLKNAERKNIFKAIETMADVVIMYELTHKAVNEKVDIDVKDKTVGEVLDNLLKNTTLKWEIRDNIIRIDEASDTTVSKTEGLSPRLITPQLTAPPVTGVVRGTDGQPLAGVNILVKGTKRGTTSKRDGSFTIEAKDGDKLVLSSIGYANKEIVVAGNYIIVAILEVSTSSLDEVQVIAYGATSRRLNIGNVTTVKSEEIQRQPVNNPLYALQGRVPGLEVTPTTGLAGGSVNLQLRGKNSLAFETSPLIVIDGLPIVSNFPSLGGTMGQLSFLNFINPNDISSIEVLKDADATSIYGSRGANGVILITSKKGIPHDTKIDVNVQMGIGQVPNKIKMLKTDDYLKIRREAFANNGVDFVSTFPFNLPEPYKYLFAPDFFVWDQTAFTDWQKELIGGAASYNDFQSSVSGGNENVQYYVNGNFHRETTVYPGENSDIKGGARLNLVAASPNKKLTSVLSVQYLMDHNTLPGVDLTNYALSLAPNAPKLYLNEGKLNWAPSPSGSSSWSNPLAELFRPYDAKVQNLIANADINYKLSPSISIKTQIGYNQITGKSFKSGGTLASLAPEQIMPDLNFYADFNNNESTSLSIEPQVKYQANSRLGNVSLLLGASVQNSNVQSQNIQAVGFKSDILMRNLASAGSFSANNSSREYKYAALFGRLGYSWRDKYLFNTTVRRDGSSRFGPGKQFGTFYSVGSAWIFSEENIIKESLPFISYGKIRVTYGTTGNDNITDYQYFERYSAIAGYDSYQGASGLSTSGIFNADYHWETTRKLEVGFDIGVLNDRILISAAYYRNRSDNQLLNTNYPNTAGPGVATINLPALIQNMGTELSVNTVNIKSQKFSWTSALNITRSRNKMVSFPDLDKSPYYSTYEIGKPFYGEVKLFKYSGVNPVSGRYQFESADGKTVEDPTVDTRVDGGKFLRVVTTPNFYGGLSNTFSWKNFYLDIFLQFAKQKGVSHLNSYAQNALVVPNNLPVEFLDRWQKEGDVSTIQKITGLYDNDLFKSADWYQNSDRGYVDASFIRLKNISLSYNFVQLQKIGIKNLRVYLQGQNVLTVTHYHGLDPEMQASRSLPQLRLITFGTQVTL